MLLNTAEDAKEQLWNRILLSVAVTSLKELWSRRGVYLEKKIISLQRL